MIKNRAGVLVAEGSADPIKGMSAALRRAQENVSSIRTESAVVVCLQQPCSQVRSLMSSKCVRKAMERAAYVPPPAMTQKAPPSNPALSSSYCFILRCVRHVWTPHCAFPALDLFLFLYRAYMGNMVLAWT